jgi:hypothetical protein
MFSYTVWSFRGYENWVKIAPIWAPLSVTTPQSCMIPYGNLAPAYVHWIYIIHSITYVTTDTPVLPLQTREYCTGGPRRHSPPPPMMQIFRRHGRHNEPPPYRVRPSIITWWHEIMRSTQRLTALLVISRPEAGSRRNFHHVTVFSAQASQFSTISPRRSTVTQSHIVKPYSIRKQWIVSQNSIFLIHARDPNLSTAEYGTISRHQVCRGSRSPFRLPPRCINYWSDTYYSLESCILCDFQVISQGLLLPRKSWLLLGGVLVAR